MKNQHIQIYEKWKKTTVFINELDKITTVVEVKRLQNEELITLTGKVIFEKEKRRWRKRRK